MKEAASNSLRGMCVSGQAIVVMIIEINTVTRRAKNFGPVDSKLLNKQIEVEDKLTKGHFI
jgi:hypothetical protein